VIVPAREGAALSDIKVLIADDVAADARAFGDALKTLGCTVVHSATVVDGLEAVANELFDILIVAWDLPDGSGIDLASKAASQALIVVTSETGTKALADELLGGRCADFLKKPLPDMATVRRRLIPLIERRRRDPFESTSITKRPDTLTEEGDAASRSQSGRVSKKKVSSSIKSTEASKSEEAVFGMRPAERRGAAARTSSGKRKRGGPSSPSTSKGSTRPEEDPSKTWLTNTTATGVFDPKLTVRVWTQGGYVPHLAQWEPADEGPLFDIEREIARGSMATVFLARAADAQDPVALKVLDPASSQDEQFRMRFRREVRSHAALTHPNIVQVLDYGRRGACYFLALELMRGSLDEVLKSVGWLPTALATLFLEDALNGIHFAHRRGVLHRDLKPANLMFSNDGVLKVADFGFAKSTIDPNQSTPGLRIGTPAYFSPEQSKGDPVGPRSDLFALGTLGHVMLTGKNPYQRPSVVDTAFAVARANAPPPSSETITANLLLSEIVMKLGARSLEDRFMSGALALADLAPLAVGIRRRYPRLPEQFMRNPVKMRRQLLEDESRLELKHARVILRRRDRAALMRGALALYRATKLDENNAEARSELQAIAQDQGLIFDDGDDRERALVERLQQDPSASTVLEELFTRARDQGRLWSYVRYLRRFVALVPNDARAARFLEEIDEGNRLAPFRKDDALSDPDLVDGSMDGTGTFRMPSLDDQGPLGGSR
jgi:DNA-binding response OmpR family regulator